MCSTVFLTFLYVLYGVLLSVRAWFLSLEGAVERELKAQLLAQSHKTSVKTLASFQLLQGPRAAASCLSPAE